jgi:hypothetical protein
MNYLKNLVKLLLFAECFLLCCVCEKNEPAIVEPTEQQRSNLASFVKFPFNEEFKNKINLEKYVLKKLGKPDEFGKVRKGFGDGPNEDIFGDEIWLEYTEKDFGDRYSFTIFRVVSFMGISKSSFEFFKYLSIYDLTNLSDLKYGINEKTTTRDIENLFGKSGNLEKKTYYYESSDNKDIPARYILKFWFKKGKLDSLYIEARF